MEFKQTTIAPAGRNKYGNYLSSGNVTKSVVMTTYAGNDTTTSIGGNGGDDDSGSTDFYCMLSQTNATFNAIDLLTGATAATQVIAYRGYQKGVTFVCDMDSVSATVADGAFTEVIAPEFMGIRNMPCGLTVTFVNNGTSASTVVFSADSNLTGNTGSLYIPICVYKRGDNIPNPDDLYNWYEHQYRLDEEDNIVKINDCELVWLEYVWNVNRSATSNYVMDLSNEKAQINCDSAGTMYSASVMTVTCTASTTMNGAPVSGVQYSVSTQPQYNARGFGINQTTGEMYFNYSGNAQYFAFQGATLPIDIIATLDSNVIGTKTMTIYKNYPGADGAPAVSHWINTSVSQIQYNPNTEVISPSAISATCWRQVGYEPPERDNETPMYYWYASTSPLPANPNYTAGTLIDLTNYKTEEYIAFGLKNTANEFYETETVPILPSGRDGASGGTGPSGATGPSGESAWYMTLSNDNASINVDASGVVLPNAVRPATCYVKLYHGKTSASTATYSISANTPYTGVTTSVTSGQLAISFTNGTLAFNDDVLQITISGSAEEEVRDVKTMNIIKSYPGENGEPARTYWLEPSFTEIIYDVNTKTVDPSAITCDYKRQIGQEPPTTNPGGCKIQYQWQSRGTGTFSTATDLPSTGLTITTGNCENYRRLRLKLMSGNTQYDLEDVDILKDGASGITGAQGRQGAAIRGPYDFGSVSASSQCWCAGESGNSCEECAKWIDVIKSGDTYYYCNHTYTGTIAYGMNSSRKWWTSGDSFDFVATKLLLAENAKIYFLTNNELYLTDENGNITGGARGGSGITFWAGAEEPNDPADLAPFRVDTEGNLYANKGIFAGYVQYPYTFVSELMPNYQVSALSVSARYLATTDWKGRLAQAPADPEWGWTYANTTDHTIYFYTSSWVAMSETGNYDGYLADGNAYLVSDSSNHGSSYYPVKFFLPRPTSAWNGFTYEIIVEPIVTQSQYNHMLEMIDSSGNGMYCYAFAEMRTGGMFRLRGGKYQITCMPKHLGGTTEYRWAITQATGALDVVQDYGTAAESTEFISTLLGTSYDTHILVNKVVTYTDTKPDNVQNSDNTMYVKKQ